MLIYTRNDPRYFDSRLYKGGDGGSGQMREQETQRQGRVQTAVDSINSRFGQAGATFNEQAYLAAYPDVAAEVAAGKLSSGREHYETWGRGEGRQASFGTDPQAKLNFASREGQYADIANAVRDTATRDLDRQYSKASQRNKFGLARAGQLGGSVDAESGGELATLYGEGKLKATQAGQQAASDLRMTDEKTRQNLISLAQAGLDTGSAESMAAGQMSAASDLARSQAGGATVGRLFDDLSQAYVVNQVGKARYPAGQPQQPSGYNTSVFAPSRYSGRVQQ